MTTRAKGKDDAAVKPSPSADIDSRVQRVLAAYPERVGELKLLLWELGVELGAPESSYVGDDEQLASRTEAELERHGGLAWRGGDFAEAGRDYARAVVVARAARDAAAEARARKNLGTAAERMGRLEDARACFDRAAGLYRSLGDGHGEASALMQLAGILRRQGRHSGSEARLRDALRVYRG
ncbi:MAG: tetratricopeptide repeat protein, partial [Stackebrandtia sp.]